MLVQLVRAQVALVAALVVALEQLVALVQLGRVRVEQRAQVPGHELWAGWASGQPSELPAWGDHLPQNIVCAANKSISIVFYHKCF